MSLRPIKKDTPKLTEEEIAKAEEALDKRCGQMFHFMDALREAQNNKRLRLTGKILTIIDASSIDKEKTKATKDLIHDALSEFTGKEVELEAVVQNRISEALYGDKGIQHVDFEITDEGVDTVMNTSACDVFFPPLIKS